MKKIEAKPKKLLTFSSQFDTIITEVSRRYQKTHKGVFIMKKALRLIALCLVLVMAVATLASCGGPSGKYSRTDKVLLADVESYWDFDGDEVTFNGLKEGATSTRRSSRIDFMRFILACPK